MHCSKQKIIGRNIKASANTDKGIQTYDCLIFQEPLLILPVLFSIPFGVLLCEFPFLYTEIPYELPSFLLYLINRNSKNEECDTEIFCVTYNLINLLHNVFCITYILCVKSFILSQNCKELFCSYQRTRFIEGKSFIIVPVNINDNLERGGTCNER